MIKHWKLDERIDKTFLFLQEYRWNEEGLTIHYLDETSKICISISFPVRVEFSQFMFVEQLLYSEEDSYSLYSAANCEGPINPFFIQELSEDEVRSLKLYIDDDDRRLTRYSMQDYDTWVTVVSSVPPKVVISEVTKPRQPGI